MASLRLLRLALLVGGLFIGGCVGSPARQADYLLSIPPGRLYVGYNDTVKDSLQSWWGEPVEYAFCVTRADVRRFVGNSRDVVIVATEVVKAYMPDRGPHFVTRSCPKGTLGIGHSHLDGSCNHSPADDDVEAVEQIRRNYLFYAVQCGPRQHHAHAYQRVTFDGRTASYRLNVPKADSLRAGMGTVQPRIPSLPLDPLAIPDQNINHIPEVP